MLPLSEAPSRSLITDKSVVPLSRRRLFSFSLLAFDPSDKCFGYPSLGEYSELVEKRSVKRLALSGFSAGLLASLFRAFQSPDSPMPKFTTVQRDRLDSFLSPLFSNVESKSGGTFTLTLFTEPPFFFLTCRYRFLRVEPTAYGLIALHLQIPSFLFDFLLYRSSLQLVFCWSHRSHGPRRAPCCNGTWRRARRLSLRHFITFCRKC